MFKIASYKLIYGFFHPFVDSLLLDAYRLFDSRSLLLCWPIVFHWKNIRIPKLQNIKYINNKSTFMSEIVDFTAGFLTKETLVCRAEESCCLSLIIQAQEA